jgi:hypothetical protein
VAEYNPRPRLRPSSRQAARVVHGQLSA